MIMSLKQTKKADDVDAQKFNLEQMKSRLVR